ncbi:hypothetical protein NDU88_008235 [Pleurodeles waltl]|uniref:Uncharacterized protein n=1 Tax=Pleurodeles waltl TaxID=8319 RepID=A0AAV7VSK7_PLEWA|nr:hypothetical protein NDU88_008235 [Pleurodeles waltl]
MMVCASPAYSCKKYKQKSASSRHVIFSPERCLYDDCVFDDGILAACKRVVLHGRLRLPHCTGMSSRQRVGSRGRGVLGKSAVRRVSYLGARFLDAHACYDAGMEVEEGLGDESRQAVGIPDSLEERPLGRASKMATPIKFVEPIVISDSDEDMSA